MYVIASHTVIVTQRKYVQVKQVLIVLVINSVPLLAAKLLQLQPVLVIRMYVQLFQDVLAILYYLVPAILNVLVINNVPLLVVKLLVLVIKYVQQCLVVLVTL